MTGLLASLALLTALGMACAPTPSSPLAAPAQTVSIELPEGGPAAGAEVWLVPSTPLGAPVSGVRWWRSMHEPVQPAMVLRADARGEVRLSPGSLDGHLLLVSAPGCAPTSATGSSLQSRVEVRLARGYPLRGKVVDLERFTAHPRRVVAVPRMQGTGLNARGLDRQFADIAADGSFYFPGLPMAEILLYVRSSRDEWAVSVAAPMHAEALVSRSTGDHAIEGTVLDADGHPVAGATVLLCTNLDCFDASATTDSVGRFRFADVAHGGGILFVQCAGHASAAEKFELKDSSSRAALRMQRSGSLAGRVLNPTGGPVAGAAVAVRPIDGSLMAEMRTLVTESAADGSYALHGLAPGRWLLTASAPGFVWTIEPPESWRERRPEASDTEQHAHLAEPGTPPPHFVTMAEGGRMTRDLKLEYALRLRGTVRARGGAPIPGAVIYTSAPDGGGVPDGAARNSQWFGAQATCFSDRNGEYVLLVRRSGPTVTVTASIAGTSQSGSVVIPVEQSGCDVRVPDIPMSVDVAPRCVLLDADTGAPIEAAFGALWSIDSTADTPSYGETDIFFSGGRSKFELPWMPRGVLKVRPHAPGYRGMEVVVQPSDMDRDIVMRMKAER